jgi:tRNA(Ile) lysidine synthetase-like protein
MSRSAAGTSPSRARRVLRWALAGAIQRLPADTPVRAVRDNIIARRGSQARNIAKVAAARYLLTCVYYAMRDGHVRSLATRATAQQAAA